MKKILLLLIIILLASCTESQEDVVAVSIPVTLPDVINIRLSEDDLYSVSVLIENYEEIAMIGLDAMVKIFNIDLYDKTTVMHFRPAGTHFMVPLDRDIWEGNIWYGNYTLKLDNVLLNAINNQQWQFYVDSETEKIISLNNSSVGAEAISKSLRNEPLNADDLNESNIEEFKILAWKTLDKIVSENLEIELFDFSSINFGQVFFVFTHNKENVGAIMFLIESQEIIFLSLPIHFNWNFK